MIDIHCTGIPLYLLGNLIDKMNKRKLYPSINNIMQQQSCFISMYNYFLQNEWQLNFHEAYKTINLPCGQPWYLLRIRGLITDHSRNVFWLHPYSGRSKRIGRMKERDIERGGQKNVSRYKFIVALQDKWGNKFPDTDTGWRDFR